MSTNPLLIFNAPIATVGLTVFDTGGALVGTRGEFNIIAGSNITVTGSDNVGASRVDITISGSAGGGTGGTTLTNIAPSCSMIATVNNFQNYTIANWISAGGMIVSTASSWNVTFQNNAGTCTVGAVVLKRTLPGGTAVTDTTPINFSGTNTFTLGVGQLTSDTVSFGLDNNHDHYIECFFTDVAGNASITLPMAATAGGGPIVSGYISTDHTGDSTITFTNFTRGGQIFLVQWKQIS